MRRTAMQSPASDSDTVCRRSPLLQSSKKKAQHGNKTQRVVSMWMLAAVFAFGLAIRAATGIHPYSGEASPPMYGDYEAQRHWMEIALHLPPSDWYRNSTDNDLSYWGLDYPPLSGYVSYAFGKLLQFIDSDAVRLHTSRGYETPLSRAVMRITVLVVDLILFFPALFFLSNDLYNKHLADELPASPGKATVMVLASCMTLPALILVDHAHFQYNNFALALFLLSLLSFLNSKDSVGAALFSAAVYFKHMTLYYALAVFAFLLARAAKELRDKGLSAAIAYATKVLCSIIATTVIVFSPWIRSANDLKQVLNRLFPLARGLYEDKVANVWCSISVIVKLHNVLSRDKLFAFCACVTAIASLPFCIAIFLKPSPRRLLLATSGCSLAAFLFSYQVHEKQVLLPLLPLVLLYPVHHTLATWMSMAAAFSLFPLLLREGSGLAYAATVMLHVSVLMLLREEFGLESTSRQESQGMLLSGILGFVLNLALIFGTAPATAPDFLVLCNTIYACAHLSLIYLVVLRASFVT